MKKSIMVLSAGLLFAACHKSQSNVQPQAQPNVSHHAAAQKSTNGVLGATLAYYDATLFKINLKEYPAGVAANLIAHNKSINTIYEVELPDETELFVPVLDAIHGDGFNPLWQEVEITFVAGHAPHQFFSDDEVLTAARNGEITLDTTNEVYRCSIIGKK